jgi:invasion protein IalB
MKKYLIVLFLASFLPSFVNAQEADRSTSTDYFGDWRLSCVEQEGEKRCVVSQAQIDKSGATVSVINVSKAENALVIEFVLPLMTDLTTPVELNISDTESQSLPYNACNQSACFILLTETDAVLEAFKANASANMAFGLFNGQSVNVNISLRGFTAAHQALSEK